ncbi:unnamed protein product [Paramecium pentaurelia]|uniref:AAA+ ATPase domain-containing protein n=1 Tax=Paramecium pentaurelia TaxID=43138 RepID=A0A8S1Y3I4_9CILI|nr:unnamed protein product [Paramecium pentaurelia]
MLSKLTRISRFRPFFAFCNQKPPQGFEKFQRKSKHQQAPQEQKIENTQEDKKEEKIQENQQTKKQEEKIQRERPEEPQFEQPKQQQQQKTNERFSQEQFQFTRRDNTNNFGQKPKSTGPVQDPNDPFKQYLFMFLASAPLAYLLYKVYEEGENHISFNEFQRDYLEKQLVSSIQIQKINREIIAIIYTIEGKKKLKISDLDFFLQRIDDLKNEKYYEQSIPISFQNQDEAQETTANITKYAQILFYGGLFFIMFQFYKKMTKSLSGMAGDMMGGMAKMKSKQFEQKIKIKFKDVAGQDEAKGEIKEFVDFLKAPKKYKKLGARIPRGALLTGPPGTGKTLLAKACAGEAGVPFFYVSGSEFVEMYVGLGAARVRELFKQAKSKAPSIVFIDEIDAVGKKRNSKGSKNEERDNTLNQLLVEMDGFGTDSTVVVLAATNMRDSLDPALTRPGRFDRNIEITLPDINGRKEIFLVHLKPIKLDPSKTKEEYAKRLATLTPGFSGAEIANLCNEAAILAARQNSTYVTSYHFEQASERVMAGLEKKKFMSEEERKIVAFHESGHAVVSWFLAGGDPLLKLTIIPRSKGSLGYAQYLPNESNLQTMEELQDKICCVLGGRVSEKYFFQSITTGASDDLKRAYDYANAIITKFGMNETIGQIGYQDDQYSKDYSDKTNEIIDEEMQKLIQRCTQRTEEVVKKYEDKIKALAELLLEKESLDLQQIINLLGERPFPPKSNYKAYLDLKKVEQAEIKNEEAKEQEQITQNNEQQQSENENESNEQEQQINQKE